MAEQNYNSFDEFLAEAEKDRTKRIFSDVFFEMENLACDIANGKKKADRLEKAYELIDQLRILHEDVKRMLD